MMTRRTKGRGRRPSRMQPFERGEPAYHLMNLYSRTFQQFPLIFVKQHSPFPRPTIFLEPILPPLLHRGLMGDDPCSSCFE